MKIKLNVGASPIWNKKGWVSLDHKAARNSGRYIKGDASNINLNDDSCSIIFCSHVVEHIPHYKIQKTFLEFSRVLERGGILRILTPDLYKIAKAYVEKDKDFFEQALEEDENIRKDLGYGGMFMNFIVSPGQDTLLLSRNLDEVIGGYAHIYSYDFEMIRILLEQCGFSDVKQMPFGKSAIRELEEPLHVEGFAKKWQNLNKKFYKDNGLMHVYQKGKYNINFLLTGFDRDPLTSLIVEAKKEKPVNIKSIQDINSIGANNYNRYGFSLLFDDNIVNKLGLLGICRSKISILRRNKR